MATKINQKIVPSLVREGGRGGRALLRLIFPTRGSPRTTSPPTRPRTGRVGKIVEFTLFSQPFRAMSLGR
jgi:hypothetical protein